MNDDELLAHLKATDPALTSKAPRPDVARLVEATMNTNTAPTDTSTSTTTSTVGAGPRRRLVPALAFAALLVVGGGVTWGVAASGGDAAKDSNGAGTVTAAPQTHSRAQPLTLTLADSGSAKCAAPTLQFLLSHQLAFEGTVTAKRGDRVDLTVDHWYRATTGTAFHPDEVRLTSDEGNSEATIFEVGTQYLVTADDGAVPICGGTTIATDEGRTMFQQAFGAPGN